MAKLYGNIASSALMTFDKSFARANGQPLDSTEVYYSLAAAQEYAAGAGAYVGQKIVVIENNVVTHYSIEDTAGTLKELGSKPVGDGQSVSVAEDGTVSIFGFDKLTNAEIGYLPRVKEVVVEADPENNIEESRHLEIEWVPVSDVVEGDGNSVTTVTAKDASVTVADTATEGFEGYKYEVNVNVSAEADNQLVLKTDGLYVAKTDLSNYYDKDHVDGIEGRVKSIEDDYLVEADKTELSDAISGVSGRVTTLETVVGKAAEGENEATGLVKDVTDLRSEVGAKPAQAGSKTLWQHVVSSETTINNIVQTIIPANTQSVLSSAKTYTDTEIAGLKVEIGKRTIEDTERECIIIKDNSGNDITYVDATNFVADGMLDAAEYNTETKKLTLTWNTDAGKAATIIDLNDLVNTYTGSDHITVGTDGVISIKDTVALKTDISDLNTKLSADIAEKRTLEEVDAQIDAKITAANLGQYAKAADMETELGKKLDKATYEADQAQYATDKETFAIKSDVETELDKKVDVDTYNTDKATFAVAENVNGQFTSVSERIDGVEDNVEANAKAIEDHKAAAAETYATKTELKATDDKAVSNDAAIKNLTGRLDGIVAQGGEPNVINNIKVNGVVQEIVDKVVDIAVPTKVSDLTDGASIIAAVNANTTATGTHEIAIEAIEQRLNAENTGLAVLNTRLAALETEVGTVESSRIDAIEGTLNGAGETAGLIETVAGHTTTIAGLQSKDAELAGLIAGNTAKFDDYYTSTVIDSKVTALEQSIANVDLSSRVAVTDFNEYKEATAATIATLAVAGTVNAALDLKADKTAVEAVASDLTAEIARATAAEEANANAISALVGEDTGKSIRTIAAEETAAVVAGADTKYDTLKEIADFILNDETGAAKMANDISDLKTTVGSTESGLVKDVAKNASDIVAINALIAANEVKESTEISVTAITGEGATGVQLGIKEVNVNKLVQDEDDVLILNGGSAGTKTE